MSNRIAVTTNAAQKVDSAIKLAESLALPFLESSSEAEHKYDYLLLVTPEYLAIQHLAEKTSRPFYIDLLSGKLKYRIKQATRKNELLARSINLKPQIKPFIIDATAGLGRDSLILAALGYEVTMIERSPIIHALLQDAIHRASTCVSTASIIKRLQLIQADAITWLQSSALQTNPDVIYLDPMFPIREKKALVKKEMIIMQHLVGHDDDALGLLDQSLACANKRVVVKRPRIAEHIGKQSPSYFINGKTSRFDIYLT